MDFLVLALAPDKLEEYLGQLNSGEQALSFETLAAVLDRAGGDMKTIRTPQQSFFMDLAMKFCLAGTHGYQDVAKHLNARYLRILLDYAAAIGLNNQHKTYIGLDWQGKLKLHRFLLRAVIEADGGGSVLLKSQADRIGIDCISFMDRLLDAGKDSESDPHNSHGSSLSVDSGLNGALSVSLRYQLLFDKGEYLCYQLKFARAAECFHQAKRCLQEKDSSSWIAKIPDHFSENRLAGFLGECAAVTNAPAPDAADTAQPDLRHLPSLLPHLEQLVSDPNSEEGEKVVEILLADNLLAAGLALGGAFHFPPLPSQARRLLGLNAASPMLKRKLFICDHLGQIVAGTNNYSLDHAYREDDLELLQQCCTQTIQLLRTYEQPLTAKEPGSRDSRSPNDANPKLVKRSVTRFFRRICIEMGTPGAYRSLLASPYALPSDQQEVDSLLAGPQMQRDPGCAVETTDSTASSTSLLLDDSLDPALAEATRWFEARLGGVVDMRSTESEMMETAEDGEPQSKRRRLVKGEGDLGQSRGSEFIQLVRGLQTGRQKCTISPACLDTLAKLKDLFPAPVNGTNQAGGRTSRKAERMLEGGDEVGDETGAVLLQGIEIATKDASHLLSALLSAQAPNIIEICAVVRFLIDRNGGQAAKDFCAKVSTARISDGDAQGGAEEERRRVDNAEVGALVLGNIATLAMNLAQLQRTDRSSPNHQELEESVLECFESVLLDLLDLAATTDASMPQQPASPSLGSARRSLASNLDVFVCALRVLASPAVLPDFVCLVAGLVSHLQKLFLPATSSPQASRVPSSLSPKHSPNRDYDISSHLRTHRLLLRMYGKLSLLTAKGFRTNRGSDPSQPTTTNARTTVFHPEISKHYELLLEWLCDFTLEALRIERGRQKVLPLASVTTDARRTDTRRINRDGNSGSVNDDVSDSYNTNRSCSPVPVSGHTSGDDVNASKRMPYQLCLALSSISICRGSPFDAVKWVAAALMACGFTPKASYPLLKEPDVLSAVIACLFDCGEFVHAALWCQFLPNAWNPVQIASRALQVQPAGHDTSLFEFFFSSNIIECLVHLHAQRGDDRRKKALLAVMGNPNLNESNHPEIIEQYAAHTKRKYVRRFCVVFGKH